MATRGFEFAYMLNGKEAGTPVIRDWPMGTIDANPGDMLLIDSGGYGTVWAAAGTVLGILQEDCGGTVTGYANRKIAIATREQVWRCSMDAATTALVPGYTKDVDGVDGNTLDADGTGGHMILVDASELDDDGNVLAYVVFAETALD